MSDPYRERQRTARRLSCEIYAEQTGWTVRECCMFLSFLKWSAEKRIPEEKDEAYTRLVTSYGVEAAKRGLTARQAIERIRAMYAKAKNYNRSLARWN